MREVLALTTFEPLRLGQAGAKREVPSWGGRGGIFLGICTLIPLDQRYILCCLQYCPSFMS